MKLNNRKFTNTINWILDNLVPPILRDNRFFTWLMFYPLFGKNGRYFMEFKEKAPFLNIREIESYYTLLAKQHLSRPTDLNARSVNLILEFIEGEKILDIACGRGYLIEKLSVKYPDKNFFGIDFIIKEGLSDKENIRYLKGDIENIPFEDNYFDTVICTHTLEHIKNIENALSELRRVAGKRIIIVVPRQRPYKYTFDLHLHFFPYLFEFQQLVKNPEGMYKIVGNDIFYMENINK